MLPYGERRSKPRSRANSFQVRKRWIFLTAGTIAVVFVSINLQFYTLWSGYRDAFGPESQTQKWVDRKLVTYSTDTVNALNALHGLEETFLRYSLKQLPLDVLVDRRQKMSEMLTKFKPGGVLWQELGLTKSYGAAFSDANAFVEMVQKFELGNATIEDVAESGEASISSWSLLKSEAMEQELTLQNSMELTVKNFRPIADSSVPVFFVLAFLSGILYVMGVYAVSKLIDIQHRRYLRFEFLVATISHDLRSPLQAIQSASFLLSSAVNQADRVKYAGIVATSIKTLTRLVDDIVLAQQGSTQTLQLSYVDLRRWLSEFIPAYLDRAASKGLELTYRIEIENVLVEIDPERLTRSVGNLIDNAIKYTSAGSVSVSVRLRTQEDKDGKRHLVFKVRDTGPGISLADQARIFMPFERAVPVESGHPNSHGMGLGLSIVQKMAQSYPGGSVTVQSEIGHGSVFRLDLPVRTCVDEDSLPPVAAGDESDLPAGQSPVGGVTKEILVVDDDPNICTAVVGILQDAGFSVDTANDGANALRKLADHAYRVVITDIQMPNMGGFELANKIRSILRPAPYLIAMTAYTSTLSEDPRAVVFDGLLAKPFDEMKLVMLVEKGAERDPDLMDHTDWGPI